MMRTVLLTTRWVIRLSVVLVLPGILLSCQHNVVTRFSQLEKKASQYGLVAAGAVVSRDVPPATLVAGVPARVERQLDL